MTFWVTYIFGARDNFFSLSVAQARQKLDIHDLLSCILKLYHLLLSVSYHSLIESLHIFPIGLLLEVEVFYKESSEPSFL